MKYVRNGGNEKGAKESRSMIVTLRSLFRASIEKRPLLCVEFVNIFMSSNLFSILNIAIPVVFFCVRKFLLQSSFEVFATSRKRNYPSSLSPGNPFLPTFPVFFAQISA